MRRLLTGGIKAILAIAALSTAAHWAMRVQREPAAHAAADLAYPSAAFDPTTTGSLGPATRETAAAAVSGLDQAHLSKLMATASGDGPRVQKAVAGR